MFDLLIRNAHIVDGTGLPSFYGEIGIINGIIVDRGKSLGVSKETINAEGLTLSPGIIDSHTHYDAQLTWDRRASPSLSLGVTTAIIGNCGFTIAPCKPEHRSLTMKNLTKVEGMPLSALEKGINWDFQTYPDYLNMIEKNGISLNICSFIGHSSVRLWAMGSCAMEREANDSELEEMEKIVVNAMNNGSIGFATSTFEGHNGHQGIPMPSRLANKTEHKRLVSAMSKQGRGVFMLTKGSSTTMQDIEEIIDGTGRPALVAAIFDNPNLDGLGYEQLEKMGESINKGKEIWGQVSCRDLTMEFTMKEPYMFEGLSTWSSFITGKSDYDRIEKLKNKDFRINLEKEILDKRIPSLFNGDWSKIKLIKSKSQLTSTCEGRSVFDIAKESGKKEIDWMLDNAINGGMDDLFIAVLLNSNVKNVGKLLNHPNSLISLSDAGAHLSFFCDAGFGLHLLGFWVRERKIMSLEEAIHKLTGKQADICRISKRGRLVPGYYADMILFDPEKVNVSKSFRTYDLPGDAERLIAESVGLHGVWVNGKNTKTEQAINAGKLIREYYS